MTDFTKQVGWSPSVPSSPAAITVATDNGDGTGYITNPDGTVVPVVTTPTVDTFATVSGSTITDPNGNSITVPAGSTYNPVTSALTTSDGNTVDLSSFDTDTDTFATLAGNVITFADGSSIDVTPMVDTNTTYTLTKDGAGNAVLTASDGSAPQVISDDDLVYKKVVSEDTGCASATRVVSDLAESDVVLTEDSIDFADGRLTVAGRQFGISADDTLFAVTSVVKFDETVGTNTTVYEGYFDVDNESCEQTIALVIESQYRQTLGTDAFVGIDMAININGSNWNSQGNGSWSLQFDRVLEEQQFVYVGRVVLPKCQTSTIGIRIRASAIAMGAGSEIFVNSMKVGGRRIKLCEL